MFHQVNDNRDIDDYIYGEQYLEAAMAKEVISK